MHDTLKRLYDRFYTPLPMEEAEQEIETCHRQLIERLEKPERKLVLRIMDAQGLIAEERSVDSFICGFRLAWELANELNISRGRNGDGCLILSTRLRRHHPAGTGTAQNQFRSVP